MKRVSLVALAVLAAAAPTASAQTPPVDGGTQVGGSVDSYLELILAQPGGFSTFKQSGSPQLSFTALATGTENLAQLSLADGDAASGSKLGHLACGAKRLPDPLEARVAGAAFQPLDGAVDPLLVRWAKPITRRPAKVALRQKVRGKVTGTCHKLLLVTLSSETP